MTDDEPTRKPRVTIVAEDDETLTRVRALLERQGVAVEGLRQGGNLRERIDDSKADVVVLPQDTLERAPEVLDETPDGPGVVVLDEGAAPAERAALVAQGVSRFVRSDQAAQPLGEQLAGLARAEAAGGLDGPEARGAVTEPRLADFTSRNARMREFVDLVARVADSESSLLVLGETGVGKERLARAIHAESSRRDGPFVSVNCGALPESLLDSELFGHEKGAFTGASEPRRGRFELAQRGTIFLDEIGEMPQHLQVKLLTVLQRREVRRLGSERTVPVDVRVLAATNRDLRERVEQGSFREDLFFRLNVVTLEIPPLRERREDVPDLTGAFLRHFMETEDAAEVRGVAEDAMGAMLAYSWPGNVRELINVVERALLLARGPLIGLEDLPPSVRGDGPGPGSSEGSSPAEVDHTDRPLSEARRLVVASFERRYLSHLLRETGGAIGETAARAGINPKTLYEKMKTHDLRKEDFRRGATGRG